MKKISKIRWAQLTALALLVALGGIAIWSQRDYAPVDEPRRHLQASWNLANRPPLNEDAPEITIPASETEVIANGANLEIRYPAPTGSEDREWIRRVDSVIRSDQIGNAKFHGAELTVSHVAIRIQTDASAFETSAFSLPDWTPVESAQTPTELRAEILNLDAKSQTMSSLLFPIQLLIRVEASAEILGARAPYLVDRQLQAWLPTFSVPAQALTLKDGVIIVPFEIATRHQADSELLLDIYHAPTEPIAFPPERGTTLVENDQLGASAKLMLAESCGYFAPSSLSREDPPYRFQMLNHTRYSLTSIAIHTEPYLPQDRFFPVVQLKNGTTLATWRSGNASPWRNPYLVQIAETRKSEIESVNVRCARRLDRVVIPLGKLRIPGGDVDNLCDLRIPYVHFHSHNGARVALQSMLLFQEEIVDPNRYGHSAVGPEHNPLRDQKPLYDVDVATLKQLAALPGERVEIDADAQQIRYVEHDEPWHRRAWAWIKSKAP